MSNRVATIALLLLIPSLALAAGPPPGKTAEDFFREGVEQLMAGQVDASIQSFKLCVELRADQKECWFNLGVAQGRKRNFRAEVHAYDRAIRLDPAYGRAHFNIAVASEDLGQREKALHHYEKAIAAEPKAQDARLNRAMLLLAMKRIDEAIAGFEAAVKVRADNPEAFFDLAEAYDVKASTLEEPDRTRTMHKAVATYYKATALNPRHHRAWYNIGVVHHRLKDPPSEIAAYRKALAIRPKYTPALYNLAFALRDSKDIVGAASALQAFLAIAEQRKGEAKFVQAARQELIRLRKSQVK